MTRKEAQDFINSLLNLRKNVEDKHASSAAHVYKKMKFNGELIEAGERINHNGTIKRAAVNLWDTEENSPENAPNLWEDIKYKNGIRIIPETITSGLAFSKDELGYWGDVVYKSKIDNNVWTPDGYPEGWEIDNG